MSIGGALLASTGAIGGAIGGAVFGGSAGATTGATSKGRAAGGGVFGSKTAPGLRSLESASATLALSTALTSALGCVAASRDTGAAGVGSSALAVGAGGLTSAAESTLRSCGSSTGSGAMGSSATGSGATAADSTAGAIGAGAIGAGTTGGAPTDFAGSPTIVTASAAVGCLSVSGTPAGWTVRSSIALPSGDTVSTGNALDSF